MLQGDFGRAYNFNSKPVLQLIGERTWPTGKVHALSILLELLIALPIGIVSATRQN